MTVLRGFQFLEGPRAYAPLPRLTTSDRTAYRDVRTRTHSAAAPTALLSAVYPLWPVRTRRGHLPERVPTHVPRAKGSRPLPAAPPVIGGPHAPWTRRGSCRTPPSSVGGGGRGRLGPEAARPVPPGLLHTPAEPPRLRQTLSQGHQLRVSDTDPRVRSLSTDQVTVPSAQAPLRRLWDYARALARPRGRNRVLLPRRRDEPGPTPHRPVRPRRPRLREWARLRPSGARTAAGPWRWRAVFVRPVFREGCRRSWPSPRPPPTLARTVPGHGYRPAVTGR